MRGTIAILSVLAALLAVLGGCGVTGGSIPPPPPPAAAGVDGVVRTAWAPGDDRFIGDGIGGVVAPSGLDVIVLRDEVEVARTTTAADGSFGFSELAVGSYTLRVIAPEGSLTASDDIPFELRDGRGAYVAVALWRLAWRADATGLGIRPTRATVAVGETVQFGATVQGRKAVGEPISWAVENGIGTITPSGRFTAIQTGEGVVRAILDETIATASVTVVAEQ